MLKQSQQYASDMSRAGEIYASIGLPADAPTGYAPALELDSMNAGRKPPRFLEGVYYPTGAWGAEALNADISGYVVFYISLLKSRKMSR